MKKRYFPHRVVLALFAVLTALPGLSAAPPPPQELVAACARGDLAAAQRLLKAGAKINDTDEEGRTPLLAALFTNKEPLVVWALENGADPNLSARCPEWQCRGHAGLVGAVRTGEPRLVKLMLDAKADVTVDNHTAARQANLQGAAEILRLLRAAGGRETGATTAAGSPAKRESIAAFSGLSTLLPAGPATARKAGAKLRVAIIASDDLRAVSDLLATSLASGPFALIERAELTRILGEHQLTAQLGADGARTAELGTLLGADALVLLRKVQLGETASAELRFVRVSPGIVLDSAYRAWPLADASAWAADAAARLANLNPKIRDDRAIAIATAPFRPLTDSALAAQLARETSLLLNDRLTRQPGVILLERTAIDALSREQSIGKAGGFWAGSYVLDGTVEPPASEGGQTAVTLRLAPIGAGEVKTFTARGPRAELPRVVAELTAQANDALKLHAAPPSDLPAEAQRHYAESRNLSAIGLHREAYRAAETAAAFGLDTDEFHEWHLDTVLQLIAAQVQPLADGGSLYGFRREGWSEAWIEQRMGGAEWLRPVEWCDLGVEAARLWRRCLLAALRAGDAERAGALLVQNGSPLGGVFAVYHSLDLAATTLDHHDMHRAICEEVRAGLEEAQPFVDGNPALAATADAFAFQTARLAPLLYRDPASLTGALTPLLSRKFSTDPSGNRIKARIVLISLEGRTSFPTFMAPASARTGNSVLLNGDSLTPHGPAARAALRQALPPRGPVDDEWTRAALDYFAAKDASQQRQLSDKLFALFWERRQFFVETPEAPRLFSVICQDVARFGNAPKFAWRNVNEPQTHTVYTPEMMNLRRKLFLLVARDSAQPKNARTLFDEYFHPPGEDAKEIARLEKRMDDDLNGRLAQAAKPVAPPNPRAKLRGTPTYAKYPPLKVARRWSPDSAGLTDDFFAAEIAFDPETNALLLLGLGGEPHGAVVFEIALPSLKTNAWPVPDFGGVNRSDMVHFSPARDFIYLAKDESFLAIGDRKKREWKLNREVQPFGQPVRVGEELFFLTQGGGARGLASLALRDHAITVLASNRRTPPQTPLDRPDLAAVGLKAGASDLIEITTEPFKPRKAAVDDDDDDLKKGDEPAPQSLVTYDPAKRVWTKPVPIEDQDGPYVFTPLTAAGPARAYKKQHETNVWTLQLPRAEMPKARVPIEFVPPAGRNAENATPAFGGTESAQWFWTPHGYFVTVSPPFKTTTVYFIPQTELDAYLDAHIPGEDATGSAPPAPTKTAAPRS